MKRSERIQELNEVKLDIARIKATSVKELLESYRIIDEKMDKIIKLQGWIHTFGIQLTLEEKAEVQARVRSISAKVAYIQRQLEHYDEFIIDERDFIKSDLSDKMDRLKQSAELILD